MDVAGVDVVLLAQVGLAGVALAVVLVSWARLQRRRFAGRERRRRPEDVTVEEVAVALGAGPAVVRALGASQVVVVELDDAGRPVAVRPGVAGVPRQRGPRADDVPRVGAQGLPQAVS